MWPTLRLEKRRVNTFNRAAMDTGLEDWNPLIKIQRVILLWKEEGACSYIAVKDGLKLRANFIGALSLPRRQLLSPVTTQHSFSLTVAIFYHPLTRPKSDDGGRT